MNFRLNSSPYDQEELRVINSLVQNWEEINVSHDLGSMHGYEQVTSSVLVGAFNIQTGLQTLIKELSAVKGDTIQHDMLRLEQELKDTYIMQELGLQLSILEEDYPGFEEITGRKFKRILLEIKDPSRLIAYINSLSPKFLNSHQDVTDLTQYIINKLCYQLMTDYRDDRVDADKFFINTMIVLTAIKDKLTTLDRFLQLDEYTTLMRHEEQRTLEYYVHIKAINADVGTDNEYLFPNEINWSVSRKDFDLEWTNLVDMLLEMEDDPNVVAWRQELIAAYIARLKELKSIAQARPSRPVLDNHERSFRYWAITDQIERLKRL